MTKKLFYEDSYQKEFEATVLSCEKVGDTYRILLDESAFFPEGGGQSSDKGSIDGIEVRDVQEENGLVIHFTDQPLEIERRVKGTILFEERFSKMQQHTGEHIVSGLVNRYFGCNNVGFHLGSEQVTMDFDGVLTKSELSRVEREANRAVVSNLPVFVSYPSREELENLKYRSKIEIQGQTRIVTIPGIDVCACCAPHVLATGEIGLIKLTGAIKYKGGMRISMLCADRALADYNEKEKSVSNISVLLSAKPSEVSNAVERLKRELQMMKDRAAGLQSNYLSVKLREIKPEMDHYLLFEEEMDGNALRRFVKEGAGICSGIVGAFTGSDNQGYTYILGSKNVDLAAYSKELNRVFHGKGGGKPQMIQGHLIGREEEIRKFLEDKDC